MGNIATLICNLFLSVAAHTTVSSVLSLRYTVMLPGNYATSHLPPLCSLSSDLLSPLISHITCPGSPSVLCAICPDVHAIQKEYELLIMPKTNTKAIALSHFRLKKKTLFLTKRTNSVDMIALCITYRFARSPSFSQSFCFPSVILSLSLCFVALSREISEQIKCSWMSLSIV